MQHQKPQAFEKSTDISERNREIVSAFNGGTKPADIANAFGVDVRHVRKILSQARSSGMDVKRTYQANTVPLNVCARIDSGAMERLAAEADRRGMPVSTFCAVLLRVIATDDLFGAIIDDDHSADGVAA